MKTLKGKKNSSKSVKKANQPKKLSGTFDINAGIKSVTVDLPLSALKTLEKEAAQKGITREALIKFWVMDRLRANSTVALTVKAEKPSATQKSGEKLTPLDPLSLSKKFGKQSPDPKSSTPATLWRTINWKEFFSQHSPLKPKKKGAQGSR